MMELDLKIFGVEGKPTTETFTLTVSKRGWQGLVDGIFKHCRGHEPRDNCSQDERALEKIEKMLGHHLTVGLADALTDLRVVIKGTEEHREAGECLAWILKEVGERNE